MKNKKDHTYPQWLVLDYNINTDQIEYFNILSHGGIIRDVYNATRKCHTIEEFEKELRFSVKCYFWGKCEWEILVSPLFPRSNTREFKVDVYDQVNANWDIFLNYVWNSRHIISQNSKIKNKE